MTLVTLSTRERLQLENLVISTPQAKEHGRVQALLWLSEGETVVEVAERLRVGRGTVYYWVHRFDQRRDRDLGERLLDAARSGRPPTAKGIIDPVMARVIDQDPRELGYRSTGWTASLLQHYLQEVHDIHVSRKSVSRALDRLGIRWKRPRHQLALRPDTWRQSKGG
jgi:transposase